MNQVCESFQCTSTDTKQCAYCDSYFCEDHLADHEQEEAAAD